MLLIKIKLNPFGQVRDSMNEENQVGQVQNSTNEKNQESIMGQRTLAIFGYAYELQEEPQPLYK